jgi:hypothetical protein
VGQRGAVARMGHGMMAGVRVEDRRTWVLFVRHSKLPVKPNVPTP